MATQKGTLRICNKGHHYYKSSDCPTCPTCERTRKPANAFLVSLSNPAQRALEHAGITTLKKLSGYSEEEILSLHGMGSASIPTLKILLKEKGFSFKAKK